MSSLTSLRLSCIHLPSRVEWKPGYVNLMQMYYKSCVHSRTIKVHELLCCINGYAMRIEGKKFEFEDTIVWVFVMHSSVEMVTKRLYLQIGAQKKARFFSLMYICESLCINRISHNYVIPQLVFCIIMPFRTSFHIPFRKLIPPFTLTAVQGQNYYVRNFKFKLGHFIRLFDGDIR